MRLQARYTIIIVTLVVIVVTFLSAALLLQFRTSSSLLTRVSATTMSDVLLRQMKNHGGTMIKNLTATLVNPVYDYNVIEIRELLFATAQQDGVTSVQVFDSNGKILADENKLASTYGQPLNDPEAVNAIQNKDQLYTRTDAEQIIFVHPIWIGDSVLGGVKINYSLNRINSNIASTEQILYEIGAGSLRDNAYSIVLFTCGFIIFGVILAVIASTNLIKPIKKLVQFAGQIAHGNYKVEIDINRTDELGDLVHAFRNMGSSLSKSTDEIRYLAYHDSLTDLPNSLALREYLKYTLSHAKRGELKLGVLFIDLDDFKRINDTLGHDIGDKLLVQVASRLKESVRSADMLSTGDIPDEKPILSRFGGDEFILVLFNIRESFDAAIVAKRILATLAQPFSLPGHDLVISASIGIALFPEDGDSVDNLLKNADMAMYHAKDSGKGLYQYFTREMNAGVRNKLKMESELRTALYKDELTLHYQPQVDIRTGKLYGAEALIRWQHPKRGVVAPQEFIPVAEKTGLINEIGQWVMQTACQDAARWNETYDDNYWVSVNISNVQFLRREMARVIYTILAETRLNPKCLQIEITETNLIYSEEQTAAALEALRNLGVMVFMDDFGTGFSSLSYLRSFPLDGVKIDSGFVRNIASNVNDLALTSAIIAMAHSLGLEVVAEGVETVAQLEQLQKQNCDICQGFLYSEPLPLEEFEAILELGYIEPPATKQTAS